ncbi:AIR synthase-related protein [Candidatus Coxiella mudrowiae]|uniref:AIR synthase-related protein n=1 Tax=Candidatus Coxiella mudrowiae TaxID=2054173 RepID=UPI001FCF950F|nr:AIR synthase-related protein [Candidatus Coxiella mudrowiae]
MQRRTQELINRCVCLGEKNPILSIHDVGAGGYSNAFPELIEASECGENLSCGIFRMLNLE